jgi:DNA polymerase III delta prime subunit
MKKRGVVLLITILFIAAMSVLVLQNLDDSEEFIKNIDIPTSLKQTQISIENINEELSSLLNKNKDNIDDILDQIPELIPVQFEDSFISIEISRYLTDDLYNLNDVNLSQNLNEDFNLHVNDTYSFFNILNEKKKLLMKNEITSNRQIDEVINEYISLSDDNKILTIKDKFTYLSFDQNASQIYVSCRYDLNIQNIQSSVNTIFQVGSKKIRLFEYTIKGK